jgi:hypothetical protein
MYFHQENYLISFSSEAEKKWLNGEGEDEQQAQDESK